MATVIMCDVKSCKRLIEDKPLLAMIGINQYELCKSCYDGLLQFAKDNLGEHRKVQGAYGPQGAQGATGSQGVGQGLLESIKQPNWGQIQIVPAPFYIPTTTSITSPNITWTIPTSSESDTTWTLTTDQTGSVTDVVKK